MGDPARKASPTIYDVAKVAGVAPSTVSRAFARPGRVNAETAARIRAVAEQLGYRANTIPTASSTTRTRMLGLVISDVANPFYAELIAGVQEAASEAEYVVLLTDAQESGIREREAIERMLNVVDCVVMGGSRMSDSALRTIAKQKPMMVLNRELRDVPSVITDNHSGARSALVHLRDLGHDSVAYAAGPEASWADGARWRAVRDVGKELGLHVSRVGPFPPTVGGGMAAGEQLLATSVTAVIAYNDLVAIGLIGSFRRAGKRIPGDISVVGFDDILAARLVTPALTTVAAPMRYIGATAVRNLLANLRSSQATSGRAHMLPVKLIVRGSTGQRSRKRTSPALGTTSVSGSAS